MSRKRIMKKVTINKMIKLFYGTYHNLETLSSYMIKNFYHFSTLMLYHFNALTLYHFNTLSLYLVKIFSTQQLRLLRNFSPSPYGGGYALEKL
jgi:hypothetical protein